jgi:hypothetical protein
MQTLLKFRWLIALVLIVGFLIYYNERQVAKGIPTDIVKKLVETAEQNGYDKKAIEDARLIDSVLGVNQRGFEDKEKPIRQSYAEYIKNYSKKKPNETDNELIEWSKR